MATDDRDPPPVGDQPLRTMFLLTSIPIGGQETLLVDLVRSFDRRRILAEVCCLKERGPLGAAVAEHVPIYENLLHHKGDVSVIARLQRLFARRKIRAVVTVGCGDKMFWGRLAAWRSQLPVIVSALHSTGWPDRVGWLNHCLTPLTDAFIGVAQSHADFLVRQEGLPRHKVVVIRNGIDTDRFLPCLDARRRLREEWHIPPEDPVAVMVAALRPEKNHVRFLRTAAEVLKQRPDAWFLVVGDGPLREKLESLASEWDLSGRTLFLGARRDIPAVLASADVFVLPSDVEASPVTILEAMACQLPVVASCVGSIPELVTDGETGFLVENGEPATFAGRLIELMDDPDRARQMGRAGRRGVIRSGSQEAMVAGYTGLLERIDRAKRPRRPAARHTDPGRCLGVPAGDQPLFVPSPPLRFGGGGQGEGV